MKAIYWRKNRKTRGIITLYHDRDLLEWALWMDWYWAGCVHGRKSWTTSKKTNAVRDMANPDEWCAQCKKIVEEGRLMDHGRVMSREEIDAYHVSCITSTSVEYARRYIKKASLAVLLQALEEIEGRGASKTLRRLIEARIRALRKEADRAGNVRITG